MFFIDKYIPDSIDKIYFHKETYNFLKIIAMDESIPHLIFYGMDGVGKKTMVRLFLNELFGEESRNTHQIKYIVYGSGNKVNEEYFIESNYHIEITPKGNNNDRYLIQDVIKKYASNTNYNIFGSKYKFKVIVIHNIQNMLSSVQFSLRRTIEKYSDTCRFILLTNSISKIIKPLISRCKCIKVTYPTEIDIIKYSIYIAKNEGINLSLGRLRYLLKFSKNIKEILWLLQLFKNNDLYLIFIKNKFDELELELNNSLNISIKNIIDTQLKIIENDITNLKLFFEKKSINKYINSIGNNIFNEISKSLKKIVDPLNFEKYFFDCKRFIKNYKKNNKEDIKHIRFNIENIENKKNKLEDILFDIKHIIIKILNTIKLFELRTDKNIVLDNLVKLLMKGNCDDFEQIRDIFFNLIITNFTGTEILAEILKKIIEEKKIFDRTKVEIIKIFSEGEFNMIKGRREINQYDMIIINVFDKIKNQHRLT
jgi:replication factor C subunit 3/5